MNNSQPTPSESSDRGISPALRKKAEGELEDLASSVEQPANFDSQRLFHELRVYQIELEMQNEELLRTRAEVEDGLARFTDLYDFAPVGYFSLDRFGTILQTNLMGAHILELDRARAIGKRINHFIHPNDRVLFDSFLARIFQEQSKQTCQIEFHQYSGESLWAQIEGIASNQAEKCQITVTDITARKNNEDAIREALREKEVLLRELYHRTKNNMQVIQGMIVLQRKNISDPETRQIFTEIGEKIRGMALVHQMLYEAENLTHIDLKNYIEKLIALLYQQTSNLSFRITFDLTLESTQVPIETAIPCGLILNELISNALKHAFPNNRSGIISIRLRKDDNQLIFFEVSDNGIGTPPGINLIESRSMGIQTVLALVEHQLQGKITFQSPPGITCSVIFPSSN